jgi:hypothetical protein
LPRPDHPHQSQVGLVSPESAQSGALPGADGGGVMSRVKKGDRFKWTEYGGNYSIEVRRVSEKGGWADIFVYDNKTLTSWTKRQKLPFPASFKPVSR